MVVCWHIKYEVEQHTWSDCSWLNAWEVGGWKAVLCWSVVVVLIAIRRCIGVADWAIRRSWLSIGIREWGERIWVRVREWVVCCCSRGGGNIAGSCCGVFVIAWADCICSIISSKLRFIKICACKATINFCPLVRALDTSYHAANVSHVSVKNFLLLPAISVSQRVISTTCLVSGSRAIKLQRSWLASFWQPMIIKENIYLLNQSRASFLRVRHFETRKTLLQWSPFLATFLLPRMLRSRKPKQREVVVRGTEESKGQSDCIICLDKVSCRGKLSVCDHWFCFTCILEWSKVNISDNSISFILGWNVLWFSSLVNQGSLNFQNTNTCPICKARFRCITKVKSQNMSIWPQAAQATI